MGKELEHAAQRFAVFANQVLQPAVFGPPVALPVGALQTAEPIPHAEARRGIYRPVEVGWRWGPVWSTAWFHVTGRVPAEMRGRLVALRFSSGTEALLWRDGVPHCGFDVNHDLAVLLDPAAGNEELDLLIEAACNHPLGAAPFWWLEREFNERWAEAQPGRLERCEIATYQPALWRLWRQYEFARQLLLLCPEDQKRTHELAAALQRATELLADEDVASSAPAASEVLAAALRGAGPPTRTTCYAVGHAHIDTAWLWTFRETRRKCLRTFATVLRLMEQYPDFRFLCGQAQQYAWVQEQSPELFAQIAARVREGRWEAGGAMWVESDCNVAGGEALVRQILHGTRYWERAFGEAGRQRLLYLPDTFGFSAALPQLMALAGLDTFVTNKLSWNETNEFPHTTFRWRGLDGTEVRAHCTPGRDYNATNTPAELQRGEKECARKDASGVGLWLQPFGYGDGGGGPTAGMIENAALARQCEGLPEVRLAAAGSFCDELQQRHDALRAAGRDLPVWDGELYLEYHRGTYTTQAWLKRANRRREQALRVAEWLTWAGPSAPDAQQSAQAARQLDEAWKLLLLNQFHDVLPGSSITAVYEESRRQHDRVRELSEAAIRAGTQRWAQAADTAGVQEPMLVLNPCSVWRSGVVECAGKLHYVADVPALGAAVHDRALPARVEPARVNGATLSNGILTATIDNVGRVTGLRRAGAGRDACRRAGDARQPLNQLVLYDDRPRGWDAWDVDAEYELKAFPVDEAAASWRAVESGPLRAAIEVARPLGQASRLTQRFILEAGSPRLDIHTHVDWHESHRLLRALFPVDVHARRATYEIQFGHVERPTVRNTSWERAMFEVCAHRWMDLSEPGFGVALLNDCKYGHSCHDGVIGLSLLRSPKFPDPQADMGEHELTYSLMVHDGDWRAAGVDHEAEALNSPLWAIPLPTGQRGPLHKEWAPFGFEIDGAAGVAVSAVKRAEDDDRLVVRLVETHGGRGLAHITWNLPVRGVEVVDLLERPLAAEGFVHEAAHRRSTLTLRPFQIATLAARC